MIFLKAIRLPKADSIDGASKAPIPKSRLSIVFRLTLSPGPQPAVAGPWSPCYLICANGMITLPSSLVLGSSTSTRNVVTSACGCTNS